MGERMVGGLTSQILHWPEWNSIHLDVPSPWSNSNIDLVNWPEDDLKYAVNPLVSRVPRIWTNEASCRSGESWVRTINRGCRSFVCDDINNQDRQHDSDDHQGGPSALSFLRL